MSTTHTPTRPAGRPAHELARTNDPATSKAAAEKQTRRAPIIREAVHRLLTETGPLTHDGLVTIYQQRATFDPRHYPKASASSIRTRVSELVEAGHVQAHPTCFGRSSMGNKAHLWQVVPDTTDPDDLGTPSLLASIATVTA